MSTVSTPPSSLCHGSFFLFFYSSSVNQLHVFCHTWLLIFFASWLVSPVISWGLSVCCCVRRIHQCWTCSNPKSSWWRRPASVSKPEAFTYRHTQAVVILSQLSSSAFWVLKLTWCNKFSALRVSTLMPSFCRLILDVGNFLNYVRTSLSSCIFYLSWHSDRACIFNLRSTSREVTQGTLRGSRSALCSSLQRPRPTRAASRCFITSWRYANWLTAAGTFFPRNYDLFNYARCGLFCKGSRGEPPGAVGAARWYRDLSKSSRV